MSASGASGVVTQSSACRSCGYELRGLPLDGACPECRYSIARSLEGDLLINAPEQYLRRLHSGLRFILNAILAQIIFGVLSIFINVAVAPAGGGGNGITFLMQFCGLIISAALAWGYWQFTEPDAALRGMESTSAPRKLIRAAVLIILGFQVLTLVLLLVISLTSILGQTGLMIFGAMMLLGSLASLVAWAVQFFAMMRYVRWVAERVPDRQIAERTKTYIWLLPVLATVGAIILMLGPLVALVLYWNMLDKLLGRIKAIMAQTRSGPDALTA